MMMQRLLRTSTTTRNILTTNVKFQALRPQQQIRGLRRSVGIVGMPNIGKSTLFNALTETQRAEAANYPFCTIEPNKGIVSVPDPILHQLATVAKSRKTIGTQIEFIDIAGLVKGASEGKGKGNAFLSHIREVSTIVQMIRCFEDTSITHVEDSINPLRDIDIIEGELMLSDLEIITRRLNQKKKGSKEAISAELQESVLRKCEQALINSTPIHSLEFDKSEKEFLKSLNLLTTKKMLYCCNVKEDEVPHGNNYTKQVQEYAASHGSEAVIVCAQLESEAALCDSETRQAMLKEYGLERTGLEQIIQVSYKLLGLITFYTVGEQETKAWTIKNGTTAQNAAAEIHTDISKGFIKADKVNWKDYIACNCDDSTSRKKGVLTSEGKEYIVKDGDCFYFKFKG
jgi:GTP-binding protein YchF